MRKIGLALIAAVFAMVEPANACIDIVDGGGFSVRVNTCSYAIKYRLCVNSGPSGSCRYGDSASGTMPAGGRTTSGISHRCGFLTSYCNARDGNCTPEYRC